MPRLLARDRCSSLCKVRVFLSRSIGRYMYKLRSNERARVRVLRKVYANAVPLGAIIRKPSRPLTRARCAILPSVTSERLSVEDGQLMLCHRNEGAHGKTVILPRHPVPPYRLLPATPVRPIARPQPVPLGAYVKRSSPSRPRLVRSQTEQEPAIENKCNG